MPKGRRPEITPDALTAALDGARSVEAACRVLECSKQALYKRADLAAIVAAWRASRTPGHARQVYRRVLEVPPETVQRLDILAKAHDTTRADIARRLVAAARRLPRPDPPSGAKVSLDLGEAGAKLAARVPDASRLNGVIRAILRGNNPAPATRPMRKRKPEPSRDALHRALTEHGGNIAAAARALDISNTWTKALIRKHRLRPKLRRGEAKAVAVATARGRAVFRLTVGGKERFVSAPKTSIGHALARYFAIMNDISGEIAVERRVRGIYRPIGRWIF